MKTEQLTFLVILILAIGKVNACSYSTPNLMGLSYGATHIVQGNAIEIHNNYPNDNSSMVRFVVEEVLKGKIVKDTLSIYVNLNNKCPGPAKYEINKITTAFLFKKLENEYYTTFFNALGVKDFDDKNSQQLFSKRILEIVAIQNIKIEKNRRKEFLKWAIRCIKEKETRWEGAFALSYQANMVYTYNEKNKKRKRKKHCKLSRKQRKEIKDVLYAINEFNYNDAVLIEIAAKKKDRKMIELALKHLNDFDRERSIWFKEINLMWTIVRISNRKDLKSILEEINKIGIYSRSKQLNELALKFIQQV